MKKILLFLILLLGTSTLSFTQNRFIARGAEPGELYITGYWYGIYNPIWGPPVYDTLRTAIYRLTENGKKLTIQYDADYFANPEVIMQPSTILADATTGVIYNKDTYSKNNYSHTALWVSFDHGENWMFREENSGYKDYFSANVKGLIYRAASAGTNIGTYNSYDYANTFTLINNQKISARETGFEECDFFSLIGHGFYHTFDCFQNYTNLTIDEEYVFGQMSGLFPDVYRGGLPGEVYISSWFPDWSYKVSFSADTGHTFRHVYICENCSPFTTERVVTSFMSDRESGVFYIIKSSEIEDITPWGWHTKVCVEHYKDYGETLVDIYCHEITKDYKNEIGIKEVKELKEIILFPNPTTGELRVTNYELQIEGIEIFDLFGRKHSAGSIMQNRIDMSDLQAGIYFVRIQTEKGVITKKIIKH
ncbi:MAG: T9SS type A sorting domain-containing protein [Bacteroidetes bacterium]|nr:T9SS type A sorting domain-containing protein [Bacteroidota bacterium]MCL2303048.1 T9SS type A sorting domain-containing protein [Lentimicrobiaceae bacterium]